MTQFEDVNEILGASFVFGEYDSTPEDKWRFVAVDRYTDYSITSPTDLYVERMRALKRYCEENDFKCYVQRATTFDCYISEQGVNVISSLPYEFLLTIQSFNFVGKKPIEFSDIVCANCNMHSSYGTRVCNHCSNLFFCRNCEAEQNLITEHKFYPGGQMICNVCADHCTQCNEMYLSVDGINECETCVPRFNCNGCRLTRQGEPAHTIQSYLYCEMCAENICRECNILDNTIVSLRQTDEFEEILCNSCFVTKIAIVEDHDEDSDLSTRQLHIPTIDGREVIRACGIEIEGMNVDQGSNAHNNLAKRLYDEGLSRVYSMQRYHEREDLGFAHIERDSSCDWEAVIGPINMARSDDVSRTNQVIKIIRQGIKENELKLTLNCGLHIHVSAERVNINKAHNLHILYTYLEDIMYRLGAAKWSTHRALVNGDTSYRLSPRVEKKMEFVREYAGNRYYGLSFSNYFEKLMNNCGCGASNYGIFEECTCTLGKCTFEFRVFNTTANTKKIHAYLALTQALVAKATDIEIKTISDYPWLDFNMKKFKDMPSREKDDLVERWHERMEFIFRELPLTIEEKESLIYCIEGSELEVVADYCRNIIKNVEVTA